MTLFTKIASTMLATKITDDTSKAGLPGIALGVIATRVLTASPWGAALVGGVWLGHKLWRKKHDIDAAGRKGAAAKKPLPSKRKPKALPRARSRAHPRANGTARPVAVGA